MCNYYESRNGQYCISTNKALLNIECIHNYLSSESYWAANIPKEIVIRSVENSLCFGLYVEDTQIGFARIITDKTTFAYLADVFVLKEYRGKGLSKWLMQEIHAHPELQTLRRWILGTRDAHGLYKQFGWTNFTEEVAARFMQQHNPDVYKK